ncbi:MAG: sulfur transferase domain-containing protein [Pseudomonadales bacterium]
MPATCRPFIALIALCTGLLTAAWTNAAEEPFGDPHLWIGDNLVIAGPPDLPALKAGFPGAVVIIDLRTAEEGTATEQAQAQDLGLTYHNLPVDGANIRDEQVLALDALLNSAPQEALVVLHCASGNRAGMLWAAGEMRRGREVEDVLEQVAPVVTKAPVAAAVRAYADTLNTAH